MQEMRDKTFDAGPVCPVRVLLMCFRGHPAPQEMKDKDLMPDQCMV